MFMAAMRKRIILRSLRYINDPRLEFPSMMSMEDGTQAQKKQGSVAGTTWIYASETYWPIQAVIPTRKGREG